MPNKCRYPGILVKGIPVPGIYLSTRTELTEVSGTGIELVSNLTEVSGTCTEAVPNRTEVSGAGTEAAPKIFFKSETHVRSKLAARTTTREVQFIIATANRRRRQRQSKQQYCRYPKKIASGSMGAAAAAAPAPAGSTSYVAAPATYRSSSSKFDFRQYCCFCALLYSPCVYA